jgi:hypothetical protein
VTIDLKLVSYLHAVQATPDAELVEVVEDLLHDIKNGGIVGLAFVALHKGNGHTADVLGAVHDHPLLTLGVCHRLVDAVAVKTRKKT